MSTPAIRAIGSSALPLLVARVRADDADRAVTADHLALLAHLLDARTYLHPALTGTLCSLVPVGDATAPEVVRGELDLHPVAGEDPDVVHPHLPGDVCEHLVPVLELDTEHRVGQRLDHRSLHEDRVVLGLGQCAVLSSGARGVRAETDMFSGLGRPTRRRQAPKSRTTRLYERSDPAQVARGRPEAGVSRGTGG